MEKRVAQLPAIRVGESLEQALMRLAARDERSLSDYIWRVLWRHAFGHAASLGDEPGTCNACIAAQCRSSAEGMR
jgi:hypothetical protein